MAPPGLQSHVPKLAHGMVCYPLIAPQALLSAVPVINAILDSSFCMTVNHIPYGCMQESSRRTLSKMCAYNISTAPTILVMEICVIEDLSPGRQIRVDQRALLSQTCVLTASNCRIQVANSTYANVQRRKRLIMLIRMNNELINGKYSTYS